MITPRPKGAAETELAFRIGQLVLQKLLEGVRQDRANRYALIKPWRLPRLSESVPDYPGDLIEIQGGVVTVRPYSGDVNDGCTLAPDRIGVYKTVIGAIFHDPWYLEMETMAACWGPDWSVRRVRKLGDRIFYGILVLVAPTWIARTYYRFVRLIGGVAHFVMQLSAILVVASICGAGCSGCASPDSPFEDPSTFTPPEYEQTAGEVPE